MVSLKRLICFLLICLVLTLWLQIDKFRLIASDNKKTNAPSQSWTCRLSNYHHSISDATDRSPGEFQSIFPAILADSLVSDNLGSVGGPGHWFHLFERLAPLVIDSQRSVQKAISEPFLRNDTILVVFREQESALELSQFSMLMLAAGLTKGVYPFIVFGYISEEFREFDEVTPNSLNPGSTESTSGHSKTNYPLSYFRPTFVADINNKNPKHQFMSYNDFISSSKLPLSILLGSDLCFNVIFKLPWDRKAKRKELIVTSAEQFFSLRTAIDGICGGEKQNIRDTHGRLARNDCIKRRSPASVAPTLLRSVGFKSKQWDIFEEKNAEFKHATQSCASICNKILIYQRDFSRKIEDVDSVRRKIQRQIDLWNSQYLKQNESPPGNRSDIIGVDINSSSHHRNGSCWLPVQLLTHSDERPVCELYNEVKSAQVILTAHGFQSLLLMMQPLHSSLIEIHPHLAWKPKVYGALQFGIRDNVKIPRGYLAQESPATTQISSKLTSSIFEWLLGLDSASCLRSAPCRYVTRSQNVAVSDSFLLKALAKIKLQFDGAE